MHACCPSSLEMITVNSVIDLHSEFAVWLAKQSVEAYKAVSLDSLLKIAFKGGPSDLGTNILQNTEKSTLYSQRFLIFIHKTPIVESHPTTREIRDLLRPRLTPTGITVYFYMSSSLIYILKIRSRSFKHSVR